MRAEAACNSAAQSCGWLGVVAAVHLTIHNFAVVKECQHCCVTNLRHGPVASRASSFDVRGVCYMFDVRDARVTFVAARGRPSPGWIRHARTQPASPCLGALPTRQRSGEGGMALWQPAECPRHVMCMRWVIMLLLNWVVIIVTVLSPRLFRL